jgi:outer membrane protein assembly factor BamB
VPEGSGIEMHRPRVRGAVPDVTRRCLAAGIVLLLACGGLAAVVNDTGGNGRHVAARGSGNDGGSVVAAPGSAETADAPSTTTSAALGVGHTGATSNAPARSGVSTTSTTRSDNSVTPTSPQRADDAVSFLVNPAHTSSQATEISDPPVRKWDVDLGGRVSYPLIVGTRVYVTVEDRPASNDPPGVGPTGARLVALAASSGQVIWGPVELGDSNGNFGADAYEGGRVYAANGDGLVRAFDAQDGTLLWTKPLGSPVTAPLTAFGGFVYVATTGGALYALNEDGGAVRWTGRITRGENSSPAVSPDGIYVSYACGSADALRPSDGSTEWHVGPWDCAGQGGTTPVVAGNRLYVRVANGNVYDPSKVDANTVLDAKNGAVLRTFNSAAPPAIGESDAFLLSNPAGGGAVPAAQDLGTGAVVWTYTGGYSGFASNVVVDGNRVFVAGDTGLVKSLNASTGNETWSDDVGRPLDDLPDDVVFDQHAAIAAGAGLLVVPATGHLVAYG